MKRYVCGSLLAIMIAMPSLAQSVEDGTTFSDESFNYVYSSDKGGACIASLSTGNIPEDVVLPETVSYNGEEFPVVEISDKAFSNANISSLTISKNIRHIGQDAFQYSTVQKMRLDVPDAVLKSIDTRAFMSCTNLSYIDFPETIRTIGGDAFNSCNSLTELVFPEGLESLATPLTPTGLKRNFTMCSALKTIVLPSTLTDRELVIARFYGTDPEYTLINFSYNPVVFGFGYSPNPNQAYNLMYYYCWPGVGYYFDMPEDAPSNEGAQNIVNFSDFSWGENYCEFTAGSDCPGINIDGLTVNGVAISEVEDIAAGRAADSSYKRYRANGVIRNQGFSVECNVNYENKVACSQKFSVDSDGNVSEVDNILVPAGNSPAKYYDINGRPLNEVPSKGLYIEVSGDKARKLLK